MRPNETDSTADTQRPAPLSLYEMAAATHSDADTVLAVLLAVDFDLDLAGAA